MLKLTKIKDEADQIARERDEMSLTASKEAIKDEIVGTADDGLSLYSKFTTDLSREDDTPYSSACFLSHHKMLIVVISDAKNGTCIHLFKEGTILQSLKCDSLLKTPVCITSDSSSSFIVMFDQIIAKYILLNDTYHLPSHLNDDCAACDNPGTQYCRGCKRVRYCSDACEKKHVKLHELCCRRNKEMEKMPKLDPRNAISISCMWLINMDHMATTTTSKLHITNIYTTGMREKGHVGEMLVLENKSDPTSVIHLFPKERQVRRAGSDEYSSRHRVIYCQSRSSSSATSLSFILTQREGGKLSLEYSPQLVVDKKKNKKPQTRAIHQSIVPVYDAFPLHQSLEGVHIVMREDGQLYMLLDKVIYVFDAKGLISKTPVVNLLNIDAIAVDSGSDSAAGVVYLIGNHSNVIKGKEIYTIKLKTEGEKEIAADESVTESDHRLELERHAEMDKTRIENLGRDDAACRLIQRVFRGHCVRMLHKKALNDVKGTYLKFKASWGVLLGYLQNIEKGATRQPNFFTWSTLKEEHDMRPDDGEDDHDKSVVVEIMSGLSSYLIDEWEGSAAVDHVGLDLTAIEAASAKRVEVFEKVEYITPVHSILITDSVTKWLDRSDVRLSEIFAKRVEQLASGQRSYALCKRLMGSTRPIFESKLDAGQRILWTLLRQGEKQSILVMFYLTTSSYPLYLCHRGPTKRL